MRSGAKLRARSLHRGPPKLPEFKPLKRPKPLTEDWQMDRAQGEHRPDFRGMDGTGVGEWTFVQANRVRPHKNPMSATRRAGFEEMMAKSQALIELEIWIRDCAELIEHDVGIRKPVVRRDWWWEYIDQLAGFAPK